MRRMSKLVMMVTSRHWCRRSGAGGSRLTPGATPKPSANSRPVSSAIKEKAPPHTPRDAPARRRSARSTAPKAVYQWELDGSAQPVFDALGTITQALPGFASARRSVGLVTGRTRRPVSGRPVTLWVRGLPYFDQVTVGIADVAALLVLVLFRRCQELSTTGAPFGVHGVDVFNPDIKETADPVGVAWRLQDDRRLVIGRAAAAIDDDPAVGQRDIDRISRTFHPAAEYFGVEAPGALDIVRNDEVGQHNSIWGRWELGHLAPPLVSLTPRFTTESAGDVTRVSIHLPLLRGRVPRVTACPRTTRVGV